MTVVDSHERYPWAFRAQQATTTRRALPAGDYDVEADGAVAAVGERKSLQDLVTTLTTGKLRYVLAALADAPIASRVSQPAAGDKIAPQVGRRSRPGGSTTRGGSIPPL
jgi:hypothetical protein